MDQVGRDVSKVTDTVMTSLHLELQRCAPALGSFPSWCISFYGSDVSFPTTIARLFIALGKASPLLDMLLLQQTCPLLLDIVSIVEGDQLPETLTAFVIYLWKKQSLLSAEMDPYQMLCNWM